MYRPDLALFVATSGHSGVDQIMKKLVTEFAGRGLRVDLLTIANHGPYWDNVPHGVRLVPLGTAHVNTSLFPLIRYLHRYRPPVLLSDKDKVNRTVLLARSLTQGSTRIAVRIGTTVSKNLERRSRLARWSQYHSIRWLYPRADAIVVPSEGVAEDLSRFARLPLTAITVIPSPVVDGALQRQAREPLEHPWFGNGQPPVILGVGELSARKDFATLINAFARLRRQRPCRLVILGEGRERGKLEALAKQLGIEQDMQLPGFSQNPFPHMARAAVFALSSTCEGSPVALIEALATGTPVVSTDCPSGPRETLQGGRYGELVPVGDAAALATALGRSLERPRPPSLLQEAARPFAAATSAQRYLERLKLT